MRVLVVDDEPLARRRLVRMLGRIPGVVVTGEAEDGLAARHLLHAERPEVVLLDIQMPELDGLTLMELEPDMPPVVFTTAYDQHAVRAFELAAVDYLLKPVQQARLEQALARARRREAARDMAALHAHLHPGAMPRLVARHQGSLRLLDPRQVTRLFASDKYTIVRVDGDELMLDDSLNSLEERLAAHGFLRVHRGELINLAAVRAVHEAGGTEVELTDGQRARVSRRMATELKRRLGI